MTPEQLRKAMTMGDEVGFMLSRDELPLLVALWEASKDASTARKAILDAGTVHLKAALEAETWLIKATREIRQALHNLDEHDIGIPGV